MGKKNKLLEKARENPDGLSFGDFETLMRRFKWVLDHQTGSHQIWYSPNKRSKQKWQSKKLSSKTVFIKVGGRNICVTSLTGLASILLKMNTETFWLIL
jgi:hypothetical protein